MLSCKYFPEIASRCRHVGSAITSVTSSSSLVVARIESPLTLCIKSSIRVVVRPRAYPECTFKVDSGRVRAWVIIERSYLPWCELVISRSCLLCYLLNFASSKRPRARLLFLENREKKMKRIRRIVGDSLCLMAEVYFHVVNE